MEIDHRLDSRTASDTTEARWSARRFAGVSNAITFIPALRNIHQIAPKRAGRLPHAMFQKPGSDVFSFPIAFPTGTRADR